MTENGIRGLLIRTATREDIPGLEEISRLTWDGYDYLDRVAGDWIADGSLATGIFQGRVAACARYTRIPGDVLWLEGLRVHPDFRGRGFGRTISEHVLDVCRTMLKTGGARGIEFSTYSLNAESRGLGEKQGFRVAEWFHILYREGMPACHCRVEPCEPSPEDFSVYPERVPVGWKYAGWREPGFMDWFRSVARAWRTESGAVFITSLRDDEASPLAPAFLDPDGFFDGLRAYASMHGRAEMELFLHDSHREMLAAAGRHGWGYWDNPDSSNVPVYRYTEGR
jgi:GNAT superfamily N-acetyltransferase